MNANAENLKIIMPLSKQVAASNGNHQDIYLSRVSVLACRPSTDENPCQFEVEATRVDLPELTESSTIRSNLQ